ncbi:hypothetical protein NBRC116587_06370 [Pseudoteredinibacter isoporae]
MNPWQVFTFKMGIRAGCMESEYRESESLSKAWQHCSCVMKGFEDHLNDAQWYLVTRQVMEDGKGLEEVSLLKPVLKQIPLCSKDSSKEGIDQTNAKNEEHHEP